MATSVSLSKRCLWSQSLRSRIFRFGCALAYLSINSKRSSLVIFTGKDKRISVGFRRKSWTLYSILFLVRSYSFANGKIFSAPSVSLKGRQERSKRIKPRSDSSSFTILETVFRSISSSIDVLDMFFVTAVVKKTCHDKRFSLGFITLSI